MKVLFVSSGNSGYGIIPFIKSQGESLINNGIDVVFFTIEGKGFSGYLKNIFRLRKYLKKNNFDIVHAHYSLSSFVASLASLGMGIPVITSLMGSDSKVNTAGIFLIKFFNRFFWDRLIVKSPSMKDDLKLINAIVVPNGVDFTVFKPVDRNYAKEIAGFDMAKKTVSFIADPKRYSKNYDLAMKAFSLVKYEDVELKVSYNISPAKMVYYINASDVVLLTSRWEGSPNIIKEALACNVPIVSTDVGDVNELLAGVKGCFIVTNSPEDIAGKIEKALDYNDRTNGRDRIKHLEINSVAKKIIDIYKNALNYEKR